MKRLACAGLAGAVWLWSAAPASATAIVYAGEGAFVAATGSTLHPLPVGPSGGYLQSNTIVTTDGALTLSATIPGSNLFSNWEAYPGSVDHLPGGPDLAISGTENLNATVAFSANRFAFGFSLYEPSGNTTITGCNAPCANSTFTITLFNNLLAVGSPFVFSPADNAVQFWGVHTDYAFDAVQVRETAGGIDNEFFGRFHTGTRSVPEPSGLLLLGTAVAMGLRRWRQRA